MPDDKNEAPRSGTIDALMAENRRFPPPEHIKRDALVTGTELYDEAATDDEGFWARQAAELLDWSHPWDTICEWDLPYAKWFVGGTLNVAANCLDRHVDGGLGERVAIHWEGEPGDTRAITYAELLAEVQRFANALKGLGVVKGDRVNIYLPMVPEAAVAMLACARLGAIHSGRLRRLLPATPSPTASVDCRLRLPHHRRRSGYRRGGRPVAAQEELRTRPSNADHRRQAPSSSSSAPA